MSKDCPKCPLVDPEGPLSSMVPSSFIIAANLEVKPAVLIDNILEPLFQCKNTIVDLMFIMDKYHTLRYNSTFASKSNITQEIKFTYSLFMFNRKKIHILF